MHEATSFLLATAFFDYMAAFFDKLQQAGVNRDEISREVHHRLRIHDGFLIRMQAAAQPSVDPSVALRIYQDAQLLLGMLSVPSR